MSVAVEVLPYERQHDRRGVALIVLLCVALAVRLGWAVLQPTDPASLERLPDQREYHELAVHLLAGEGYWFVDPRFDDRVYAHRMPGYPLFIALLGGSLTAVRVAQALIDASTVLAVYLLARRWIGPAPGLFAGALVAFNPFMVYFSALLLTETIFTAMLAWGMVLLVRMRSLLWGGIVLALAVLIRPSGLFLPVILGVSAVLLARDPEPDPPTRLRWRLPVGATMLLLTVLVLLPWGYHNHRVLGEWIFTTTNAGITRYDGFNPDATGASDQSFVREMPWLANMNELEREAYFQERASAFIRENPRRVLWLTGQKVLRTWSPVPLSSEYGTNRLYVAAGLLYGVPLFLLVLLGLWAGNLPRPVKCFLLIPAAYFTVVHAASVGSLRYRIPAEPPMAVVAASLFAAGSTQDWRRSRTAAVADNGDPLTL